MPTDLKTECAIHHSRVDELSELIRELAPPSDVIWSESPNGSLLSALLAEHVREYDRHTAALRHLGVCEDTTVDYRGFQIRIHDARSDRDFDWGSQERQHIAATLWGGPARHGVSQPTFVSESEYLAWRNSLVRYFATIEEAIAAAKADIDEQLAGDSWREGSR